jgi:hypothetical protein
MQIKPELKKAFEHYQGFVKVAVKSKEHLDVYLKSTKLWTEDEQELIVDLWDKDNGIVSTIEEEAEVVLAIEEMTKKELDAYAEEEYGIELDRRQTHKNMIKELKEQLED